MAVLGNNVKPIFSTVTRERDVCGFMAMRLIVVFAQVAD